MWLLFCGMSIDAGIALGIFCHKLTINIKDVLTNIKQIQLLNDIFFKPNASKTVFDQTMFERKNGNKVKKQFENVGG